MAKRDTNQDSPTRAEQQAMCKRIYKLHLDLFRRLNDVFIFSQQAMPLLEVGRSFSSGSKFKGLDKRYYVPGKSNTSFARRTDKELQEIFKLFLDRDLYASLILLIVSTTESFIFDVLENVLMLYPRKLGFIPQSGQVERSIPISLLFESTNLSDLTKSVIQSRLHNLSYASPRQFLAYLEEVTGVNTSESAFSHFVEIKATRDIVIHNRSVINSIYTEKAGPLARGKVGDVVRINEGYFRHAVSQLKRLSGIVKRDIEKTFAS